MDWTQVGADAIKALVPIATVVLVYLSRRVLSKLPRFTLPILALAFGFLADFVLMQSTGGTFHPMVAVLLGAAGVWLREIVNTIQQHGTSA